MTIVSINKIYSWQKLNKKIKKRKWKKKLSSITENEGAENEQNTLKKKEAKKKEEEAMEERKEKEEGGEISMILLLHSHSADVNAKDKYGQTPLHFAAMTGNLAAAEDLVVTCKADVEVRWGREGER